MQKKLTFVLCLALLALTGFVAGARAANVEEVIEEIAGKLKGNSEVAGKKIAISGIVGAGGSTAGPGIAKRLGDALKKTGLKIVEGRGEVEISGEARPSKNGLRLEVKVKDEDGNTLTSFDKTINDEEDVGVYTQPNVQLPKKKDGEKPQQTDQNRATSLFEGVKNPDFQILNKTQLVPGKAPYAIEIFVKGKALPLAEKDGKVLVNLNVDDEYTIRIHNKSNELTAVNIAIDGLSVFEFSEIRDNKTDRPQLEYWIVSPNKTLDLTGWHKNFDKVHKFKVGKYSDDPKVKLKQPANASTITAVFAAAWKKGDPTPKSEADYGIGSGDLSTHLGPEADMPNKAVDVQVGRPRAIASLRYKLP